MASRGKGSCPRCAFLYSTRWKPSSCPECGFELGGTAPAKVAKMCCPKAVEIHGGLFTVRSSSRDDRCFVYRDGLLWICLHAACKDVRAMFVSSDRLQDFSCQHTKEVAHSVGVMGRFYLSEENIASYPCDESTKVTLRNLTPPNGHCPVYKVSDRTYVVYGSPSATNTLGFCHVKIQRRSDDINIYSCSCKGYVSKGKQEKSRAICSHLHVLFCVLALSSSGDSKPKTTSAVSSEATTTETSSTLASTSSFASSGAIVTVASASSDAIATAVSASSDAIATADSTSSDYMATPDSASSDAIATADSASSDAIATPASASSAAIATADSASSDAIATPASGSSEAIATAASASSDAVASGAPTANSTASVSRVNTMELHSSFKLPYEFDCQLLGLINYKDAATYMGTNEGWPTSFDVMDSQCGVCGSPLGDSKAHPGSRGRSMLYTNLNAFKDIVITVRECTNSLCKAMHRVIPTEYGLFNICDKVLVSFDILLEWRELFKRGCPVSNFIAAKTEQLILKIREDLRPSSGQLSYINALLYNGFWAFEMCTERDLSSVVCGVCGTIGEVYFGDGNEKNCCSNSKIVLPKDDQALKQLSSLEQFLDKCRSSLLEKVVYTNCDAVDSIHSEELPPVIAPVLRGASVYNTEHQKRSVYLQKNQATGDPAALHKNIKECNLEMSQLSKYSEDMLRDLASDCHIPVTGKSKAKLCADIYALYSSMLVGLCPCHGYSKVKGHTGGFYHFVCRHGCTVASKFLTLTESVRDAADLFLSLKYPPVVFVCDSPCGFVRHLECRDPELCTQLWGENSGCFEKPEYAKKPTEGIDMPMIVPSEFRRDSVTKKAEDLGQCEHPATGSTRRFVLGDRFHNSKNPHKSALCLFHNIDLCAQKNAIKTSYQESENFRKNLKRLRSATMQGFGLHFCYNFLMDFYQNEEIVKKQKSNLAKHLKEGQEIIRDEYHRLCIVNSTFKC